MDTHTTHGLEALESQVGGHAGVMTTEDGSLIIKPALARELEFYQAIQSEAILQAFRQFTPKFLGVLKLQGQVDPAVASALESLEKTLENLQPVVDQKDEWLNLALLPLVLTVALEYLQSIVLENLSFSFSKPNILDVKLGTVLHDEDAPPEKVERMLKTAQETTSFETGIRLTGFQVYDNLTSKPVNTPKSYGKSIKPSDLPEGIARFFPVITEDPLNSKDAGEPSHGLPRDTLVPLLEFIRAEILIIREALASVELRMVGASLLIIYEADWERAAISLAKYQTEVNRRKWKAEARVVKAQARVAKDAAEDDEEDEDKKVEDKKVEDKKDEDEEEEKEKGGDKGVDADQEEEKEEEGDDENKDDKEPAPFEDIVAKVLMKSEVLDIRINALAGLDWDAAKNEDEKVKGTEDEDEDMDEDEDEDDEEDEEDEEDSLPELEPPFMIKLIDFAHTRLKPGHGPDEGVLRGVDTLLELLDARLKEISSRPSFSNYFDSSWTEA